MSGKFLLRPRGPYDFELSSAFYRRSKFEMVDKYADRSFMRPVQIDGVPALIKIPYNNGQPTGILKINWQSLKNIKNTKKLRRILMHMFYLDFDIERFYDLPLDRIMRRLIGQFRGFRPILTPDIFEAAAWAIIGQQVNLQFAYRLKSRLISLVGRKFNLNGEEYYLFPTASEIANLDYNSLRSMQLSGRKAEYLLDFARLVADGKLDLEELKNLDYESAVEKLLAIRGLGPWSANYILMRGAGHQDAFPVGDSGINTAVNKLYGMGKKPDPRQLLQLSERWRPYRSLATFYLWKSL
jgi:DNA-3-methyladenine glycosylase II